jgi:CheY-like chemotaxis protein
MTEPITGRPAEILLVEDNPGDVRLTEVALQAGRISNNLHVVKDGVDAMDFLHQEGEFAEAPRPDLILLDLNLPRKDGREVLTEIAADEALKQIPVVILTLSQEDADILGMFDLGAKSYIVKPVDIEQLIGVVTLLRGYWSGIVDPPSQ